MAHMGDKMEEDARKGQIMKALCTKIYILILKINLQRLLIGEKINKFAEYQFCLGNCLKHAPQQLS